MPQTDVSPLDVSQSADQSSGVLTSNLGAIRLVSATGPLSACLPMLRSQVLAALADHPRGIICDVTGSEEYLDAQELWQIADLAGDARVWPSTPVVAVCTEAQREMFRRFGVPLRPEANRGAALRRVATESRAARVVRTRLQPHPQSCRNARDFLDCTWREWNVSFPVDDGKLVVNELMRRILAHARSPIRLSLAADGQTPWLMVRELRPESESRTRPFACPPESAERPSLMVEMLCSAWGSLPTYDGSQAYWAALAR